MSFDDLFGTETLVTQTNCSSKCIFTALNEVIKWPCGLSNGYSMFVNEDHIWPSIFWHRINVHPGSLSETHYIFIGYPDNPSKVGHPWTFHLPSQWRQKWHIKILHFTHCWKQLSENTIIVEKRLLNNNMGSCWGVQHRMQVCQIHATLWG